MGVEVWVTVAALSIWFAFPVGMIISNYLHDNGHFKVNKDEE